MSEEHRLTNVIVPLSFTYNYRVGAWLDKYIDGLGEKKILAVKCPECGKVILPPRQVCGNGKWFQAMLLYPFQAELILYQALS